MKIVKRVVLAVIIIMIVAAGVIILPNVKIRFNLSTAANGDQAQTLEDETGEAEDDPFFTSTSSDLNEKLSTPVEMVPLEAGDVTEVLDTRFRIPGTLISSSEKTGVASYIFETGSKEVTQILNVSQQYGERDEVVDAVLDYMLGNFDALYVYLDDAVDKDNLINYYYKVNGSSVALLFDTTGHQYISIIPNEEGYLYVYSFEEFYVTTDTPTRIFNDITDNVLASHTYSQYETEAVANSVAELLEQGYDLNYSEEESDSSKYNYARTDVTYTNSSDNETRDQLASYGEFEWDSDGTSEDTSYSLDLTSEAAKNSRWTLTENSFYTWTSNGLKLDQLYGSRTSEYFKMSGVVTNMMDTPRPWVLVVEFLDSADNLLGLKVVDKRMVATAANGTADFGMEITTDDGIAFENITAVQFIIY